jgi:iron complex transport system substrate-binding protein
VTWAGAAPVEIVDDLERTITLAAPAVRVIPLYGAFAEMLYAVGAGPAVLARTQADQHPPEIATLPSVGTHMRPNVEMILGFKPDLVLQSASRGEAIPEMARVRDAGVPVAVFAPKDFAGIFTTMVRLGTLTGTEDRAQQTVAALKGRLEAVRARTDRVERRPRVFFEVRAEPLTAAGTGSIVHQVLAAAGADNVVSSSQAMLLFSVEQLLANQPDFYIVQQGPMNKNPPDPAKRAHFDQVKAIREGRVLVVDEHLYSRPGPRCVDAVEELARALYPDLMSGRPSASLQ